MAKEAAMTGRSIMVVYPKDGKVEIATYNLFRHKVVFDSKKNIKEAWIYINRIDNKDSYSNVICEHRYYGKDGLFVDSTKCGDGYIFTPRVPPPAFSA